MHSFFKHVKQWEIESKGFKGRLPLFYYDSLSFTAIYTAATRHVKKLLPLPDMYPVEFIPGRALAAFTAFKYRHTDIDPYNEFSIAFLITYKRIPIPFFTILRGLMKNIFSAYVWQLPVTTELARIGGVAFYGYPKFIADITFHQDNNWIYCELSQKGKMILSLKGQKLNSATGGLARYITYSVLDDIPIRTNIHINPLETAKTGNKRAAVLEVGTDHPIANTLNRIDLSVKPIQYQYSARQQAILFPGRNLLDN
jgi:hypothetical protein